MSKKRKKPHNMRPKGGHTTPPMSVGFSLRK